MTSKEETKRKRERGEKNPASIPLPEFVVSSRSTKHEKNNNNSNEKSKNKGRERERRGKSEIGGGVVLKKKKSKKENHHFRTEGGACSANIIAIYKHSNRWPRARPISHPRFLPGNYMYLLFPLPLLSPLSRNSRYRSYE